MDLFNAAHGKGHTKICHTYPAMMKLGTVIPYLEDLKIYKSRDAVLEF